MKVEIINENEIKVYVSEPYIIQAKIAPKIDLSGLTWVEPPRLIQIKILDDNSTLENDNGNIIFCIPKELDEYKFYSCDAYVTTPSSEGNIEIAIKNITKNKNVLSQNIIIEEGEYTSFTSSIQPVINNNNALVNMGDFIGIEVINSGKYAKGLGIFIRFKKEE